MKITNHHELRNPNCKIDCSSPKITDQSQKNLCDINVIMANYAKTGMLSHVSESQPRYIDCTTIPNLEQAYKVITAAENTFYELPATIRKLMDNDPSKLELFVQNPDNADLLIKHGLMKAKEIKSPPLETEKNTTETKGD